MQTSLQLNADELDFSSVEKIRAMFAHQRISISLVNGEVMAENPAPMLKDLPRIMAEAPHLTKEEADDFAADIEKARQLLNSMPVRNVWES